MRRERGVMKHETRIAIIGAGLGGATAAILLERASFNVKVYEQAPKFTRIGAGINLGPNVARILRRLGIATELERVGLLPQTRHSRDGYSGAITHDVAVASYPEIYGAPLLIMHRGDLQEGLVGAVKPGTIEMGKRLIDLRETSGALQLTFADGTTTEADIVIGADGINSKVREILLGHEPPTYTGSVAYRAIFPASLLGDLKIADLTKWWGEDRHILAYYLSAARDEFYFVTDVPEGDWGSTNFTPMPAELGSLRKAFSGFHSDVQCIIDACPEATRWPIFEREPKELWSRGNIVLLGDACHPMKPHMGQGAAMAIEDAVMLARCIERFQAADVPAAFKLYEAHRFDRTSRVQRQSHKDDWMRFPMDPGWLFHYDVFTAPLDLST
jgi:6-hydroxynicotinate 3-monooxygenase